MSTFHSDTLSSHWKIMLNWRPVATGSMYLVSNCQQVDLPLVLGTKILSPIYNAQSNSFKLLAVSEVLLYQYLWVKFQIKWWHLPSKVAYLILDFGVEDTELCLLLSLATKYGNRGVSGGVRSLSVIKILYYKKANQIYKLDIQEHWTHVYICTLVNMHIFNMNIY